MEREGANRHGTKQARWQTSTMVNKYDGNVGDSLSKDLVPNPEGRHISKDGSRCGKPNRLAVVND